MDSGGLSGIELFSVFCDDLHDHAKSDACWDREAKRLDRMVTYLNATGPDLVVVAGDMTNARPQDGEVYERQKMDVLVTLAKVDAQIPVLYVPGSHDLDRDLSNHSIRVYEGSYGPPYFSHVLGDSLVLGLNASLLQDPQLNEPAAEEQMAWLRSTLEWAEKAKPRHILVFQHTPPFPRDEEESVTNYNFPLKQRQALLELFKEKGVEAILRAATIGLRLGPIRPCR